MISFIMLTLMYEHVRSEMCPNPYPSQGCIANLGGRDCASITGCYDSTCCRAISTCSGWCDGDSCIIGATCYCQYEVKESCLHTHTPHFHSPHIHSPHYHFPSSGGGGDFQDGGGGLGAGAITGIVIGSLVGIFFLAFCVRFLCKSRRYDTQCLTELTPPGIKGPEDGTEQPPATDI